MDNDVEDNATMTHLKIENITSNAKDFYLVTPLQWVSFLPF